MGLVENVLFHGSILAVILTVYLLADMRGFSPRIWGFSDYSKEVTQIVELQTR